MPDCTDRQIHHAAQNPVELDYSQVSAVEARIILDLRIGAAFTRLQTLTLQPTFPQISNVVSYGQCYLKLSSVRTDVCARPVPISHAWFRRVTLRPSEGLQT
jgi:hypothetical protein